MIIYLLTNRANGKYYVGQTTQALSARLKQHASDAERKNGPLQTAIKKYGMSGFDVQVLSEARNIEELNSLETLWIITTAADQKGTGYNCCTGGKNKSMNQDTRLKISVAHRGKVLTDEHKHNIEKALCGRKKTGQALENITAAIKNMWANMTPEERQRRSDRCRALSVGRVPWNKGTKGVVVGSTKKRRKATEQERERLTQIRHKQVLTPERNAKISATMRGRTRPELQGKVPWNKGLKQTPEQIEKNRTAHLGLRYPNRKSKLAQAQGK